MQIRIQPLHVNDLQFSKYKKELEAFENVYALVFKNHCIINVYTRQSDYVPTALSKVEHVHFLGQKVAARQKEGQGWKLGIFFWPEKTLY